MSFIELTRKDDTAVSFCVNNISWFEPANGGGTSVYMNVVNMNNHPYLVEVKEEYKTVKSLMQQGK